MGFAASEDALRSTSECISETREKNVRWGREKESKATTKAKFCTLPGNADAASPCADRYGQPVAHRLVLSTYLLSPAVPFSPFSRALPPFRLFRHLHTSAPRATITVNSVAEALELIRSQPSHYVRATLAGKELILTPRDLVTVPRLKDVHVGDVLTLDAITELGSREYTIRGNPYIPTRLATISATVVENTMGKMEEIFKKKRRKGYQRTIKHKQTYTRLRVGDIQIHPPDTPLAS